MHFLYDLVIFLYVTAIRISAFAGILKAQQWIAGRRNWKTELKKQLNEKPERRIWIHCASLGEFEQGRPLIEKIKESNPELFIILTFFSPSGFEIRKNYPFADLVCYLPPDTKKNAQTFIDLTAPSCVLFVKYEYWNYYFRELKKKQIPLYLVSALFRPGQIFFKWYGRFYRQMLKNITFFFVQDDSSGQLLNTLGLTNFEITGDTRFDRVKEIVKESKRLEFVEQFLINKQAFIAGSTWGEDENILIPELKTIIQYGLKIIIAPHEVNETRITEIISKASEYIDRDQIVRYSSSKDPSDANLLVIDNIGLLSSVYKYGTVAMVGGGFGKGIHNILEAVAYGLPVIFGPNYKRFREANDLIELQSVFSIHQSGDFKKIIDRLLSKPEMLKEIIKINYHYVDSHTGATEKILMRIKPDLI